MKKMMMIGILGMVLVGLASAGLVSFLSNEVTGSVEVSGPVFWLDKVESGWSSDEYDLKLNDDDVYGISFTAEGQSFFSDSLGVTGFYPLEFEVILDAMAEVDGSGGFCENVCDSGQVPQCLNGGAGDCYNYSEISCEDYCENFGSEEAFWEAFDFYSGVNVILYLVNEYGGSNSFVCHNSQDLEISNREEYSFTCVDDDDVLKSFDESDRLKLVLSDASNSGLESKVYIGNSRVELEVRDE